MCVFFYALKGDFFMKNSVFLRLTETERLKKFDSVIRRNTENLLNAGYIKALAKEIHLNRQYIIAIHPAKKDNCEVLIDDNILHIYIPEQYIKTNQIKIK